MIVGAMDEDMRGYSTIYDDMTISTDRLAKRCL